MNRKSSFHKTQQAASVESAGEHQRGDTFELPENWESFPELLNMSVSDLAASALVSMVDADYKRFTPAGLEQITWYNPDTSQRDHVQSTPSSPSQEEGPNLPEPKRRTRKRNKACSKEMLKEKKRVAAREFRRKKKEHVMFLEDRLAALEKQNKELLDQINNIKSCHKY